MKRLLSILFALLFAATAVAASSIYLTTATPTVGTSLTTVFASPQILDYPNWCVEVTNTGSVALSDAAVDASGTATGPWTPLYWVECDSLVASASCTYCVSGSAYRFIRIQAKVGSGSTSTSVIFTAN